MEPFKIFNLSVSGIFFLSILSFVVFLILLVIHYNVKPLPIFSFIKTNLSDSVVSLNDYKSDTVSRDTWLKNLGENKKIGFSSNFIPSFDDSKNKSFTLSFDCYLTRTYISTDVPRVLFYFADSNVRLSNNSQLKETTGATAEKKNIFNSSSNISYNITSENEPTFLTSNSSDILTKFNKTNFIIYIDPIKNDMKFGVFLQNTTGTTSNYLEILPVLKNIPVEIPFQITFILTNTFAEIYKNKELYTTYKTGKQYLEKFPQTFNPNSIDLPYKLLPGVGSNMYGPIDFIQNTVRVGNIQYVNTALTSEQVRNVTNELSPPTFFTTL